MAKDNKKGHGLTYFLDHPQIKRHPSVGNQNPKGSLAEKINWGGKNTESQNQKIKADKPSSQSGSESKGSKESQGMMSSIRKAFGGK